MTIESAKALIPVGRHAEMHRLLELEDLKRVMIIGSYQGVTAQILYEAFGCELICIDPQKDMCAQARERLPASAKIYEFGLGDKNAELPMVEFGNNACSFFTASSERQPGMGQMVDVRDFWGQESIGDLDLILFNCEGGEFSILQRMYEIDLLKHSRYFLIQFHMALVKGNGENYAKWVGRFQELGFTIMWTLGSPWTLWEKPLQTGEVVTVCPECAWQVPEGKDPVTSLRGHRKKHKVKNAVATS